MNWTFKSTIAAMTIAAITLIGTMEPNTALGSKTTKDKGTKDKDKSAKKNEDPQHQYEHALEKALHHIKEAEKAVLNADIKELNLANTNPAVIQRLTLAVQAINHAYGLTEQAKALSPTLPATKPGPAKGKDKDKSKGK